MANVKMNPVIDEMRGKVGELVFKRYGDALIVTRAPSTSDHEGTPGQLAVRERFREAALYGKLALAQPAVREVYMAMARERKCPVTSLTIADFFHAPVVDKLDVAEYTGQIGQAIVVQAHDDFEVVKVTVRIDNGAELVESGLATEEPPRSGRWVYTTQQAVSDVTGVQVTATANDRPGNVGTKTATK